MATRKHRKPALPRGAQRWFIAQARREIEALADERNPHYPIGNDDVDTLIDHFRSQDARGFMEWEPDDAQRFRLGVARGSWGIDYDAFTPALCRAIESIRPAFASLDEWLRADIAGTAPAVKGGDEAIPAEQRLRLSTEAQERRWPKE